MQRKHRGPRRRVRRPIEPGRWLMGLSFGLMMGSSPSVHAEAPLPWPRTEISDLRPSRWERELDRREQLLRTHRGRSPHAVLALLGLLSELDGEIESARLEALLREVGADKRRHPLVRSFARMEQARLAERQGDRHRAKDFLQADGHLLAWQITGPFDNGGRRGENTAYGPEVEAYDGEQSFDGKVPGEPLGWRGLDYESIPKAGYVSFDDLLYPNVEVTGYATCWVHVDRDTKAAIHVGSGGPYRIWVDGGVVGGGTAYRPIHPLQDTHALVLQKGWNRILVKTSALERAWGFHARLSDAAGNPIDHLEARADAPEGWTPRAQEPEEAKHAVASLRRELEAARSRSGGRRAAAAGYDLAAFLEEVHPHDFDDDVAIRLARAVDQELGTARSAWLAAQAEHDPGDVYSALRRGIERARAEGEPARTLLGQMLLELAWHQRSVGLEDRYDELVDQAFEVAPDDAVVELELIERAASRGLDWVGVEWLRDLVRRNPGSDRLALALASRLQSVGRAEEALALLEQLSGGSANAITLAHRIELLLGLGRPDEAAKLGHAVAGASPGLPAAHATVARLEEARGDAEAARAAWSRAIALAPQDPNLHAELGRLLIREGDVVAAKPNLQRSLDLRPQQPELRDLLANLTPASKSDFFSRHLASLPAVAKQPTPASWAGKSAGVLHHKVAVKVLSNGLTERLDHRIVRILDDRGVRQDSVQSFTYDPAESIVEVRRARVHRQDGTIEELGDVRVASLASAGYRMYYDQRQIRVVFDGLRVGDTLEVAFFQRDVAAKNMFDEYFGDMMPLQGLEPIKRVEYLLEAPASKPIYFNRADVEKRQGPGGVAVYHYVADDVAAIKPESGMPGWTEVAPFLHASTYRTWDEVGDWYWELVKEQLIVDDEVRDAIRQALEGLPPQATVEDKVAALYTYVVRNTRYVGLEFGIHGYKPYRTTEVLSRRFGDCKDKASLLKVMLDEVGIESHLVLVRTRDQGTVPGRPASLAIFNHAITYVPALDLFLDGTAEWSGPRELPGNDQGATVLVVKDGQGADFRTIPMSRPEDNVRRTDQVVVLQPDGGARVQHRFEVRGASASSMRYGFAAQEQRNERIASLFGELYPGASVEQVRAPGIGDIAQPARLEAELEVPRWGNGTAMGAGLRFRVLGRDSGLTQQLASQAERTHDLVLDVPSTERHRLEYRLPEGHRFAATPSSAAIESAAGRFQLTITPTEGGAEVQSELTLRSQRIRPQEYADFRTFLRRVDEKLEQNFEVVPAE